ncbi:hypothetical protein CI610_03562 [invertebrate metagenome]|uniref:Uncharacterized protein n=1 Tax=invertebrate metagenome TaxID=1711999 RepID=A0A2H9T2R4_9ZZZZ
MRCTLGAVLVSCRNILLCCYLYSFLINIFNRLLALFYTARNPLENLGSLVCRVGTVLLQNGAVIRLWVIRVVISLRIDLYNICLCLVLVVLSLLGFGFPAFNAVPLYSLCSPISLIETDERWVKPMVLYPRRIHGQSLLLAVQGIFTLWTVVAQVKILLLPTFQTVMVLVEADIY